jgi:hypothetical protein
MGSEFRAMSVFVRRSRSVTELVVTDRRTRGRAALVISSGQRIVNKYTPDLFARRPAGRQA